MQSWAFVDDDRRFKRVLCQGLVPLEAKWCALYLTHQHRSRQLQQHAHYGLRLDIDLVNLLVSVIRLMHYTVALIKFAIRNLNTKMHPKNKPQSNSTVFYKDHDSLSNTVEFFFDCGFFFGVQFCIQPPGA